MRTIALLALLAIVVLVSGCVDGGNVVVDNNETPVVNDTNQIIEPVIVSDGTELTAEQCSSRSIEDVVVVIHSPGCPACGAAVPVLEEIAAEMPEKEFRFLSLATDREAVEELGLIPTHIPTAIIKCKAYVGAYSKERYLGLMGV